MTPKPEPSWIEPTQARSREKVARLLDAAVELAVERGSLDIKVTDIAKRAGVAIGTLYQFFPNRSALIGKLFAREMEPIDARLARSLTAYSSLQEMQSGIETEMKATLELVRARPGLLVIWSSPAIDPEIEAADFANTRKNADILATQLNVFLSDEAKRPDVHATALIICHLWGSVIRLCVLAEPHEEAAIMRQYASMLAAHAGALFSPRD